jgi:hypothetical protein
MIPRDPDDDLRRRFKALRKELEHSTPSFRAVWRRAQNRALPRIPVRAWLFATTFLLLMGGLTIFRAIHRQPAARSAPAPVFLKFSPSDSLDIIHWRSPTEGLLKTPGADLLSTTFHSRSQALPTHHPQGA